MLQSLSFSASGEAAPGQRGEAQDLVAATTEDMRVLYLGDPREKHWMEVHLASTAGLVLIRKESTGTLPPGMKQARGRLG